MLYFLEDSKLLSSYDGAGQGDCLGIARPLLD